MLALLRAREGDVYHGPLTKWGVPAQIQWRYFRRPADAYTFQVLEVHRLPRPLPISRAAATYADQQRLDNRRYGEIPIDVADRTALCFPAPGQGLEASAADAGLPVECISAPLLQVPAPFAHLLLHRSWHEVLLLARWRTWACRTKAGQGQGGHLEVLAGSPPRAWAALHCGQHGAAADDAYVEDGLRSAQLDMVLWHLRVDVAPSLARSGRGLPELTNAVAALQSLADQLRPLVTKKRTLFRHSEERLLTLYCASRYFRNRQHGLDEARDFVLRRATNHT